MYVVTVSREEVMDYLGSAEHTLGINVIQEFIKYILFEYLKFASPCIIIQFK